MTLFSTHVATLLFITGSFLDVIVDLIVYQTGKTVHAKIKYILVFYEQNRFKVQFMISETKKWNETWRQRDSL